jgi:hypothetical protein
MVCRYKYDLDYVFTGYVTVSYSQDLKAYYAVIGAIINNIQYSIEFFFLDSQGVPLNTIQTNIYGNNIHILTLPGYSLTPANIKEKLKSYILFS